MGRTLPWDRLMKFGLLQLFNAVSPLLILPVVISIVGQRGWVDFANGFSVGAAAAVLIGLAWPITGPHRVAGRDLATAQKVYHSSVVSRLCVFLPANAVALIALWFLTKGGDAWPLAAAMSIATSINGLTPSWYYIGRAEPSAIVKYETLPKLLANVITVPVVAISREPMAYPIILCVVIVGGYALATRSVLRERRPTRQRYEPLRQALRRQFPLASAGVLSTGATALAVPVASVSAAGVAAVASFAAATRLRSMAQAAIAAGTTALQGWVSEEGEENWWRRARKALAVNAGLGLLTAVGVTLVVPLIDTIVFHDVQIGWTTALGLGITCMCYAVGSSLTNHVLAPAGLQGAIVMSTTLGSIVGAPAILLLANRFGAAGAMAGVALAEASVVVALGSRALVLRSSRRNDLLARADGSASLAQGDPPHASERHEDQGGLVAQPGESPVVAARDRQDDNERRRGDQEREQRSDPVGRADSMKDEVQQRQPNQPIEAEDRPNAWVLPRKRPQQPPGEQHR